MQNRPDLIGFGAVAVDDLFYIPKYPASDSKIQIEKHLRLGGGLAGTALVAAARLGANPSYFGLLGDDDLSTFTRDAFEQEGVSTDLCIFDAKAKPLHSIILVDQTNGVRTIFYSLQGFRTPLEHAISRERFSGCEMILIDTFAAPVFSHVCRLARELEIPILADIEDCTIGNQGNVLDLIDFLIFNLKHAIEMTGYENIMQILNRLESPTRQATVITAGAKGCWFKEIGKQAFFLPAYKVDAVDTTGCGDVFHGAFAASILRQNTIPDAVIEASAAAAIKATVPGGRTGIPKLEQLHSFIANHNDIKPEIAS